MATMGRFFLGKNHFRIIAPSMFFAVIPDRDKAEGRLRQEAT